MEHRKITLLLLRITLGALFLYSGLDKLLGDFTSSGYLLNVSTGIFSEFFSQLAGSALIDFLVVWGEILIGLSLILGVFLRFACSMGILMMSFYYISVLPPEHGFITQHIIYILVFTVLASYGAGRYLGIDKYLEKLDFFSKRHKLFRFLLG